MSVNSTSLFSSSLDSLLPDCSDFTASIFISTSFNVTRICLLLPVSVFILYLAHRQWRQQRSFKTMSHSDVFTYNNAVLELICSVGTVFYLCGYYCNIPSVQIPGSWVSSLVFSGEICFHLLTCVERYLAVVHPIIYLRLRNSQGVWIRNISIGCAWLLCFLWSTLTTLSFPNFPTIHLLCVLLFSLVTVSFCSLSVLCVLIRPGPGDVGSDRKRADQLKHRAFFTIMAITGVLWLWFIGFVVSFALGMSLPLCESVIWVLRASGFWFMMPGSLVLPLLYLHRTGKLSCCC